VVIELTHDIVFGICWYNDASIFRLLDSIPKEYEKIIIDGKFKLNPNKKELSDESLRLKVLEYDNVKLIDAPNLSEPEKRQKYLDNNNHKYLIIIDSDEYIKYADWERFYDFISKLESGIHHVFFEVDENGGTSTYPRLWVNPSDWKYAVCHNIFKNDKLGLILKSGFSDGETCPGLLCGMDDKLRTEEYVKNTYDYQVEMIKFEKPYREKYRKGDMTPFV
jgi:hypothetical protein